MKATFILAILTVLRICSLSQGSFGPLYLPGAVMTADRIVEGKIIKHWGKGYLEVKNTLYGPADCKQLKLPDNVFKGSLAHLQVGQQGYFIVHRDSSSCFHVYHPSEAIPKGQEKQLLHLIQIRKNPSLFLDTSTHGTNNAVACLLGRLFRAGRVNCSEYPPLGKSHAVTFRDKEYHPGQFWQWHHDSMGTVHIQPDPKNKTKLNITIKNKPNELTKKLVEKIQYSWDWPPHRKIFRHYKKFDQKGLTFTIDNRKVKTAKGISRQQARSYLHACLESKDKQTVLQALDAIGLMHDTDSIDKMIELLNDERSEVVARSAEILSRTRAKQAAVPLIQAYKRFRDNPSLENKEYPLTRRILLKYMARIDHPEIAKFIEAEAENGNVTAISTLPWVADNETMGKMFAAIKRNPKVYENMCMSRAFAGIVKRSNKPFEPWMLPVSSTQEILNKLWPKWCEWWEKNQKDFRIVRTYPEAWKINK